MEEGMGVEDKLERTGEGWVEETEKNGLKIMILLLYE